MNRPGDEEELHGELRGEVVLDCEDLSRTIAHFVDELGFRLELIGPAESPSTAVVAGHGIRLRLERGENSSGPRLRLTSTDPEHPLYRAGTKRLPGGAEVEIVLEARSSRPPLSPELVYTKFDERDWKLGRAGMFYRDLIPGRLDGHVVGSHIRIPSAGPVDDYVHYHDLDVQLIYCYRGWVELVYEDQGPPFTLSAGDCVLQPPHIRHRVLESSANLEVIELASPADHDTLVDDSMELPTPNEFPERVFGGGQQFALRRAADATWRPSRVDQFEANNLRVDLASAGRLTVSVLRRSENTAARQPEQFGPKRKLSFLFGLSGAATLRAEGRLFELGPGDSALIPISSAFELDDATPETEILLVEM